MLTYDIRKSGLCQTGFWGLSDQFLLLGLKIWLVSCLHLGLLLRKNTGLYINKIDVAKSVSVAHLVVSIPMN